MPKSASRSTRTARLPAAAPSAPAQGPGRRCILGVFAHPDDETSGCGGAFTAYARQGVAVHVATATRGEMGTLGAGGLPIAREDLPKIREEELRAALRLFGAQPPILLGYRDQQVKDADPRELAGKLLRVMEEVQPDVVITFGPLGISRHEDHMAVHRAAVNAFHRYRRVAGGEPRLFYVAVPRAIARQFEIDLDGPETEPNVMVDISETVGVKVQALRGYRSQEDAQELAALFEQRAPAIEAFHQAFPPAPDGRIAAGFWD